MAAETLRMERVQVWTWGVIGVESSIPASVPPMLHRRRCTDPCCCLPSQMHQELRLLKMQLEAQRQRAELADKALEEAERGNLASLSRAHQV